MLFIWPKFCSTDGVAGVPSNACTAAHVAGASTSTAIATTSADVAALRAARAVDDVVPAFTRLRGNQLVQQAVEMALGHRDTSFVSASRSVCRAAVRVAPTVPGLMPSASAIVV